MSRNGCVGFDHTLITPQASVGVIGQKRATCIYLESVALRLRRQAERPQVRRSLIRYDDIRHIHQRLWQLPYGNCGHTLIRGRIDRLYAVTVFQANVDAASITGAPDAVRQISAHLSGVPCRAG